MRLVLMGPPGVGKGTQAGKLTLRLGVPHVSTGDILREAVQKGTPLGRRVRSFLESGQLVPDELMGELVAERLREPDAGNGFILDGFPRTVGQVAALDRVMAGVGMTIDRVLMLKVSDDEIVRRLAGRRICPVCGRIYHLESRPPADPAGVCDGCGAALALRPDDAADVVVKRLRVYELQTLPVAQAYRERGILREVDGAGDEGDVLKRLQACLA